MHPACGGLLDSSGVIGLGASGLIRYTGVISSNGFVINVARGHGAEVERRLEALTVVGDVTKASPAASGSASSSMC